jgi:hypothetical protein
VLLSDNPEALLGQQSPPLAGERESERSRAPGSIAQLVPLHRHRSGSRVALLLALRSGRELDARGETHACHGSRAVAHAVRRPLLVLPGRHLIIVPQAATPS